MEEKREKDLEFIKEINQLNLKKFKAPAERGEGGGFYQKKKKKREKNRPNDGVRRLEQRGSTGEAKDGAPQCPPWRASSSSGMC